jgi:hypothetical protein
VKLLAYRAGLPGKAVSFFDAPLNTAYKAGLADALPVKRSLKQGIGT